MVSPSRPVRAKASDECPVPLLLTLFCSQPLASVNIQFRQELKLWPFPLDVQLVVLCCLGSFLVHHQRDLSSGQVVLLPSIKC